MLYKLNFLMTAIRKTTLQVAYFQVFTNLTTELYTSNDRFGLKPCSKAICISSLKAMVCSSDSLVS